MSVGGGGGGKEWREGSSGGHEKHRWTPFERDCIASLDTVDGRSESSSTGAGSSGEEEERRERGEGGGGSGGASGPSQGALWEHYEATALSIARLYQGQGWLEFQAAAAASTQLYKDSMEAQRRAAEAGRLAGRQRLVKELLGYLRSAQGRGPFVRRQDLLAFLAGRSPPTPSPLMSRLDSLRLAAPGPSAAAHSPHAADGLRIFGQALHAQAQAQAPAQAHGPGHAFRANSPRRQQLQRFFTEEMRRHRKRGAPTEEEAMEGSPPASPAAFPSKRHRRL